MLAVDNRSVVDVVRLRGAVVVSELGVDKVVVQLDAEPRPRRQIQVSVSNLERLLQIAAGMRVLILVAELNHGSNLSLYPAVVSPVIGTRQIGLEILRIESV